MDGARHPGAAEPVAADDVADADCVSVTEAAALIALFPAGAPNDSAMIGRRAAATHDADDAIVAFVVFCGRGMTRECM